MYYIGVDGGGTNTRVCVIDENKKIVGIGKAGPSSIDTVSINQTIEQIQNALCQVISNPGGQIISMFIGLGGVLSTHSKGLVENQLRLIPQFKYSAMQIENDVYGAYLGGLETRCGIVVISGTGSVAFGIDEQNKTHRAGGYGYQEGDYGSAYHLGKKAINLVARVLDNRISKSNLTIELSDVLGVKTVDDFLKTLRDYHDDRTKVASLAPIITKYANLGYHNAMKICDEAVEELILCIKTVNNELHLANKEIAIIGSLGNSEGYFKERLHQEILKINKFHIHGPLIEPAVGGAYQALINAKKNNCIRN